MIRCNFWERFEKSVQVVKGAYRGGSQSGARLKSLSTNQIAGFAHLHKQNGVHGDLFFSEPIRRPEEGSRDRKWIFVRSPRMF